MEQDGTGPLVVDAARTAECLPFPRLIAALRLAFVAGANTPLRHQHVLPEGATLLLMPAWEGQAAPGFTALGVKIVTVHPGNGRHGLNAVHSTYLLCDGTTGRPLAMIDGNALTGRRTVAASALAADYLARLDAETLLIVGAGHIAGLLAPAYAAIRGIRHVRIWNVRPARAEALATTLHAGGFPATVVTDLPAAVATADIIACATLATEPLIHGGWLRPGAHLDLIGGFRPTMREADDDAIRGAAVYIDTEAALTEAGDIVEPLRTGVLTRQAIGGTLAQLCRGEIAGRASADQVTLFKSVGSALEDLAAARLVMETVQK